LLDVAGSSVYNIYAYAKLHSKPFHEFTGANLARFANKRLDINVCALQLYQNFKPKMCNGPELYSNK
jgi:hypothetical protein